MTNRKPTELQLIHADAMKLGARIKDKCEKLPNFHLLVDSITKLSNELHTLVLNEIKGTDENN